VAAVVGVAEGGRGVVVSRANVRDKPELKLRVCGAAFEQERPCTPLGVVYTWRRVLDDVVVGGEEAVLGAKERRARVQRRCRPAPRDIEDLVRGRAGVTLKQRAQQLFAERVGGAEAKRDDGRPGQCGALRARSSRAHARVRRVHEDLYELVARHRHFTQTGTHLASQIGGHNVGKPRTLVCAEARQQRLAARSVEQIIERLL